MKKRIITSVALLIALLLSLAGCDRMKPIEYCELGIVLNVDFEPYDSQGAFDVAYADGNVIMGMMRYSFVDCEEYGLLSTHTPEKLAEVYLDQSNDNKDIQILKSADVPYYYYTSSEGYVYLVSFYRTPYAYFIVTYITPYSNFADEYDNILDYMESAYILEEHL